MGKRRILMDSHPITDEEIRMVQRGEQLPPGVYVVEQAIQMPPLDTMAHVDS